MRVSRQLASVHNSPSTLFAPSLFSLLCTNPDRGPAALDPSCPPIPPPSLTLLIPPHTTPTQKKQGPIAGLITLGALILLLAPPLKGAEADE